MDKMQQEEKLIKNLMKHSLTEMPFQDFEDRMMDQIRQEQQQKKSVNNNLHLAWLFFFLGLFMGLLITSLTVNLNEQIHGIPLRKIALFVQFAIAVILLFQFDRLLNFSFRRKN